MTTTLFNSPLREFKTLKAARKYLRRLPSGYAIRLSTLSAFDMYHEAGKTLYQIVEE